MEVAGKMAQQGAVGRYWRGRGTARGRLLKLLLPVAALVLGAVSGCAPQPPDPVAATARHLDAIREQPAKLEAFLRAFPKGADLHNHLSGAIYAESFIRWAIADGLCIDERRLALAHGPCKGHLVPASAVRENRVLLDTLIAALSMKDFKPDGETGHDHFFATFDKFSAAETDREGDMLADALQQAAKDHVVYLELMWSPGMPEARHLGKKVGWNRNLAQLHGRLMKAGIDKIVTDVRAEMDRREAYARDLLHCSDPARRQPACDVAVRYLAQIIRVFPPDQVFAQDVFAFRLVEADPRFVGLNIVGPEDDPISLHDYSLHMRMFSYLHRLDPRVAMSLHAGELVAGQRGGLRRVHPEDLRFHIREAVETAGARRIGHGVDIEHEDDWRQLMAEMAAQRILVEINLTSNAQILGVTGAVHPFMTYWAAGVPVALSTDDEGVERIDLTHEYVRATRDYHLSFAQLVTLSRNALAYGFVPGVNLWSDIEHFTPAAACGADELGRAEPSPPCAAFLAKSEKARLQWKLEAELARFEQANY
jgi:adenosine deaminase